MNADIKAEQRVHEHAVCGNVRTTTIDALSAA